MQQKSFHVAADLISKQQSQILHILKEYYSCFIDTDLNIGWRCGNCDATVNDTDFYNHWTVCANKIDNGHVEYTPPGHVVGIVLIPLLLSSLRDITYQCNLFIDANCASHCLYGGSKKESDKDNDIGVYVQCCATLPYPSRIYSRVTHVQGRKNVSSTRW